MVLATTLRAAGGEARVLDFMAIPPPIRDGRERRQLIRIVEGVRGAVSCRLTVAPRFDYGTVSPLIRHHGHGLFSAVGGDDGLVIWSDAALERSDHVLAGELTVRPGERVRLSLEFERPEAIESERPSAREGGIIVGSASGPGNASAASVVGVCAAAAASMSGEPGRGRRSSAAKSSSGAALRSTSRIAELTRGRQG